MKLTTIALAAGVLSAAITAAATAQSQETKPEHPAVNPGRPTITDPAGLTAPGWLETEMGVQRNLTRDILFQTPILLKLTSMNNRLQYRVSTDGYDRFKGDSGQLIDGLGDTYLALQYLAARQSKRGWDTSVRGTVKAPTASGRRGVGTGKTDYGLLLLASKDITPSLHIDLNAGYSALGKPGNPGFDNQAFASASATLPIPHTRWSYTNEVVFQSGVPGQGTLVSTMHGLTYAVRPWDVWDLAVNFGLTPDTARYQLLLGRTFFLGRVLR